MLLVAAIFFRKQLVLATTNLHRISIFKLIAFGETGLLIGQPVQKHVEAEVNQNLEQKLQKLNTVVKNA